MREYAVWQTHNNLVPGYLHAELVNCNSLRTLKLSEGSLQPFGPHITREPCSTTVWLCNRSRWCLG